MKKKAIIFGSFIIAILGALSYLILQKPTQKGALVWRDYTPEQIRNAPNPHDFDGAPMCPACHVGKQDLSLKGGHIKVCETCHTFAHANHPVAFTQPTPVTTVPLGDGNIILCRTCHEDHDMKKHPAGLRMPFTPLCKQCHYGH